MTYLLAAALTSFAVPVCALWLIAHQSKTAALYCSLLSAIAGGLWQLSGAADAYWMLVLAGAFALLALPSRGNTANCD